MFIIWQAVTIKLIFPGPPRTGSRWTYLRPVGCFVVSRSAGALMGRKGLWHDTTETMRPASDAVKRCKKNPSGRQKRLPLRLALRLWPEFLNDPPGATVPSPPLPDDARQRARWKLYGSRRSSHSHTTIRAFLYHKTLSEVSLSCYVWISQLGHFL